MFAPASIHEGFKMFGSRNFGYKTTNITMDFNVLLMESWTKEAKTTTKPSDILEDFASLTFWIAP